MADDDEVWNQIDDEEDTEEEGGSHGLTEEELDYLPPDDDDEDDEGPDDDDPTPPEVIAALGFDPDHADWLTSDAEPEIDPYDRWLAQYYRGARSRRRSVLACQRTHWRIAMRRIIIAICLIESCHIG